MKIYVIDPRKKTVEEVDYDDNIESMYKLLGHDCDEFQGITMNHRRDTLYIDACSRTTNNCAYSMKLDTWKHKRYKEVLLGRGLIIGTNEHGDSIAPSCLIADVLHEITWRQ